MASRRRIHGEHQPVSAGASLPPEGQTAKVFDVVQALHQHYREIARTGAWWERMPLVLYT